MEPNTAASSTAPVGAQTVPTTTTEPATPAQTGVTAPSPRGGTVTIPDIPFRERIKRAGKTAVDAEYSKIERLLGTRDLNQLSERMKKLQDLEAKEEEARRAAMNEIQRAQAERDEERALRAKLEADLREAQEEAAFQKQDAELTEIARQHVADDAVRYALHEWARYMKSLPEPQKAIQSVRDAKRWIEKFAKDHPKYAKETGSNPEPSTATAPSTAPRNAPAPTPRSTPRGPQGAMPRPISNGAPPSRKEPPPRPASSNDGGLDVNGKTVKPGRANSMSSAEVIEFARSKGIRYPGARR